jgi:hypothetical protein
VEFYLQNDSELVYSPALQFYTDKVIIYFGPQFLAGLDSIDRYSRFGYRLGLNYIIPESQTIDHEVFIQFEIDHLKYKFNTVAYDLAVPGIPIKATSIHERIYTNLSFNFGLSYHFMKRFFANGQCGIGFRWTEFNDPPSESYYQKNGTYTIPTKFNGFISLAIELGINF